MTPFSKPFRLPAFAWLAVPLCALAFVAAVDAIRIRHVEFVSAIADEPAAKAAGAGPVAADYGGWRPRLVVPEHNNATFEWLSLTRQMLAHREWRVHHIDYENAPFGRDVSAASPYRWWLGLVAWSDHRLSGRPWGESLERAALVADPLLHVLLLAGTAIFVAWRFGALAAALVAAGMAAFFPFAAEFLPGMPEDGGLARICAIWSVLPLIAGVKAAQAGAIGAAKTARRWFFVAGIAGGLGLWVDVSKQVPVLLGVAIGAFIAAWVTRRVNRANPPEPEVALPWRVWALGGAATTLAAYLAEFAPEHLGIWELRVIHPLYAVAWLGGGELLLRATGWIAEGKPRRRVRDVAAWVAAILAVAALPVGMRWTHGWGFLTVDLPALRLARLPTGPSASNLLGLLVREGFSGMVWATFLPWLLVGPAVWLLFRRSITHEGRTMIAVALGPVLVVTGFACRYLNEWSGVDALLFVLLAAVVAASRDTGRFRERWLWTGIVATAMIAGAVQIAPRGESGTANALNPQEIYGLIERDLARWLVNQRGNREAVVLAPHNQAATLHYYGGIRGLPTLSWENSDGLGAAVRITSASTPEEAKELIERREITQIVIPSWDSYLDVYAQMGMGQLEGTFLSLLHDWKLPLWLRPVPYQLPAIAGFEGQAVTLLAVVEEQDEAAAQSRLAEYFIEMGQLDRAAAMGQSLRRFPADLGALVARAEVEIGRGDQAAFSSTIDLLRPRLSTGADRSLPWDRRLALAVVLTQAKLKDLARDRLQRCIAEIDEAKLRSLSTGAVYRLLVLSRAYEIPITNEHARELAMSLLPDDMRARL